MLLIFLGNSRSLRFTIVYSITDETIASGSTAMIHDSGRGARESRNGHKNQTWNGYVVTDNTRDDVPLVQTM